MNNLQMSLGNSKQPLCFTLGNIELSFSDKCCKRCHAPRKFWIPPPGRTTKLCQCCWKKHPEPPTRFTIDVPAKELLTSNTPFIIESSNIENFKMLFLPPASTENNNSQNTLITPFDKVLESFNKQKSVIEGAEKVLEDSEKMRNFLSENVKSLKKNMNDIGQRINEVSNQDKVIKEEINVTQFSSTESNHTKSVATIAKRRAIELKRKSTKDSLRSDIVKMENLLKNVQKLTESKLNKEASKETLRSEILRVENLLKNVQKLTESKLNKDASKETLRSEILRVENLLKNVQKMTESKLKKDASFKVKTLETINTFETDQTDSDPWVQEDFDKNNIKTMEERSTTYEMVQSLRLPTKNVKNKSIQTSILRPVPMIKFQTTKKPHSMKHSRYIRHKATAIHPKKAMKEAVMTPNKSTIKNFQNPAIVENLMKKLADSMRKSKKLLDSIHKQDGIVESMQNKFIQEVEKLYQQQQSMLTDLYDVSKNSIDPQTSDISSSNESIEHYRQEQLTPSFPRGTELVERSHSNERIATNEIHSLSPEEVAEDMHTIETTLAKAQGKLAELKKEYKETTKLLLNASTTENKAVNKSAEMSKIDSGYSTMNRTMPRENPDFQKVDNDIVCETVIKQTLRNVTIPELTKSNLHSPLAQSIQNMNQAAIQLLPTYTNDLFGSESAMGILEGPLESFQSLQETPKKIVRVSDKFKQQSPVMKPASGRFYYNGKPSSIESFGPLPEYPFNITDSDPEELGSRQGMDTPRRKFQSPHPLKTMAKEAAQLENSKHHHRHEHLKPTLSDPNVKGNKFSPPSSSIPERNRLPEYHDWAETTPKDFSTPKPGRLKNFDHAAQLSNEDMSMHNPHHHHHHQAHQEHHPHHHNTHQEHHHDLSHHPHHHNTHQEHHQDSHHHHDSHNSPEHHAIHGHARHDLRRLRRRIDKLYEDIMSS